MKLSINIPTYKTSDETLIVTSNNDCKIFVSNLSSSEKKVYNSMISLTENSEIFQIDNYTEDVFVYRICQSEVSVDKYIDYDNLSSTDKKIVDDFVKLIKNKL